MTRDKSRRLDFLLPFPPRTCAGPTQAASDHQVAVLRSCDLPEASISTKEEVQQKRFEGMSKSLGGAELHEKALEVE